LPLAPGEVYLPGYRVSARYLNSVNASNTTFANTSYISNVYQNPALQNRYANRAAPRALTVVTQGSFTAGLPVAGRTIAPPSQWQQSNASARPPGIAPSQQSVLGSAGQTPVRRPPTALATRPVVARRAPPPAPPSFQRQMDAMHANGGQALPPAQLQRLRGADDRRPNIVLAPHVVPVIPVAPAIPATPPVPAAPAAHLSPAQPAAPARSIPNDRRAIPERSPQFQASPQIQRQALPQPAPPLPVAAPREIAPPPPPPPAPAPPQKPAPKQGPQPRVPERVKGEPP
jgi:hypothetical protein